MSQTLEEIERSISQLDPADRARLQERLTKTIDFEELRRRVASPEGQAAIARFKAGLAEAAANASSDMPSLTEELFRQRREQCP